MRVILPSAAAVLGGLALLAAAPADAQVAADGERLFRQRCAACHSTDAGRNMVGPSLAGVFGRDVASVDGARYSPALRDLEGVWDEAQLDAFLADPRGTAPGTMMTVSVPNGQERAAIIAFLAALDGE